MTACPYVNGWVLSKNQSIHCGSWHLSHALLSVLCFRQYFKASSHGLRASKSSMVHVDKCFVFMPPTLSQPRCAWIFGLVRMVNKLSVSFPCPYRPGRANVMPVQSMAGMSTTKQFRFQSAKGESLLALVRFPAMDWHRHPGRVTSTGIFFASESPGLCKSQAG